MTALDQIRTFHDDLTALRRDFHAHPEIGFTEHRTADIVAGLLESWGIEVHRGIGGTGVVGVLRRGNGQQAIGLRADMDALPIHEETGLAYASQTPGVMHACGHDGHTTMLLGTARYLATQGRFNGTVHFIFQPAEEGLGGAQAMLKDALFTRFPCHYVYGMHNRPGLPVGQFAIRPGAMMAGGAFFDITITGIGAHGARPEASVDPVVVGSQIVSAVQSIVARNVPPAETAVLSITSFQAGDAYNVIPQTAVLRGTARTMARHTMDLLEARLKQVATNVAAALGATADVDFRYLFAPLINDAERTTEIADAAAAVVGEANIERHGPTIMASEDFSFMMEAVSGAYINIGNGDEYGSCQVHNPAYDFNDEALPYGAAMFATLIEQQLPVGAVD